MKTCFAIAGLIVLLITSEQSFAQNTYLSQDKIQQSREYAEDSLNSTDIRLVAIATQGELDVPPIGTFDGFNTTTGKSLAWGYLWTVPDGSDYIGIGIAELIPGVPFVQGQRGNPFGVGTSQLDLSGPFSGSDAFVTQLNKNTTYQQFRQNNPDRKPDNVVIADDVALMTLLPESFPLDKPIWGIYYGTTISDSSLVCFTASGTGETYCISGSSSSVNDPADYSNTSRISVFPNPVRGERGLRISVQIPTAGGSVTAVDLVNSIGQVVGSLTAEELVQMKGGDHYLVSLDFESLAKGAYYCRIVRGSSVEAVQLVVQ